MKEDIVKILKKHALSSMNTHADFDNIDETQFDVVADEVIELYSKQDGKHTVTARQLINEKYGTQNITNLDEFVIPLSSALDMMEDYMTRVSKSPNKSALLDAWNTGYNIGCEDTHEAYRQQM